MKWLLWLGVLLLVTVSVFGYDFELRNNCLGDAELSSCGVMDSVENAMFLSPTSLSLFLDEIVTSVALFGMMILLLDEDSKKRVVVNDLGE